MGNSSSSLPYTIGPAQTSSSDVETNGWILHSGQRKSDSISVTVFKSSKPTLAKTTLTYARGDYQLLPALHHYHKIKTLIHPNIIKVYATLDTDYPSGDAPSEYDKQVTTGDLIIVTEPVVPLTQYLNELDRSDKQNPQLIAWGLHNVISALGFLHNTAKLAHGNVSPQAVYVTPGGDFKLSSFELVTPVGIEDGGGGPTAHFKRFDKLTEHDYRSPERVESRWDAVQSSAVHAMDSFGLGMLIQHIYSHPNVGTNGQIPQKLLKAVHRLQTPNIRMRPRVIPLLKCPVFDNPYVKTNEFLDGIAATGSEEKIAFLLTLPDLLSRGVVGRGMAVHKVLPVCVGSIKGIVGTEGSMVQDVNRREVLAVIPPLFQIAETHLLTDPTEFNRHITPIISLLFAVNDRGVRGALLSRVTLLSTHLDTATLNSSVFEPMCSGFTDSSAPLRELTLKSTIVLVPHLSPANLEKLTRYLIRLQSDPESSIRTNTVIFIGKIAPNLTDTSRSKLILPAFTRAMKDPFTPCRLAALQAILACRTYFDTKSVAEKVLPAVVPHLMDGTGEVREHSFRVVDEFLVVLREESRRMALGEGTMEGQGGGGMSAQQPGGGTTGNKIASPPTSGGYLSGLSSWITSSAKSKEGDEKGPVGGGAAPAPAAGGFSAANGVQVPPSAPAPAPHPQQPAFASLTLSDARIGGGPSGHVPPPTGDTGGGGGWSDDDDDDDHLNDDVTFGDDLMTASSSDVKAPSWAGGGDDDLFASFDMKPAKPTTTVGGKTTGSKLIMPSKGVGGGKTKLSIAQKKAQFAERKAQREKKQPAAVAPAPAKKLDDDDIGDGWDDF